MIVQQCYEEGITEAKQKSDAVIRAIKDKNTAACVDLAERLAGDAARMEQRIVEKADGLQGWTESELRLSIAQQRLGNVELICDMFAVVKSIPA